MSDDPLATDLASHGDLADADDDEELARALLEYQDLFAEGQTPPREAFVEAHHRVSDELDLEIQALEKLDMLIAPPEVPRDAPRRRLGDFEIIGEVGRGGMGIVYEARQLSLDRRVALKVLHPDLLLHPRSVERFRREGMTVAQLAHPNIVPVYAAGFEDGTPYLVMELAEGRTLGRILRHFRISHSLRSIGEETWAVPRWSSDGDGSSTIPLPGPTVQPPDPDDGDGEDDGLPDWRIFPRPRLPGESYYRDAADAFAGAAEGLQYAHSKGVVHRDIKPSNLILSTDGRLRIVDFGLAAREDAPSLTTTGRPLGTILYMSPEQAQGKKVGPASDIYSLGASLYEVIGCRPPSSGGTTQEILRSIVDRDPPSPRAIDPEVPRNLEKIVMRCLRKRPERRYATAEALAQDLRRFVRGDPVEAEPEPWVEKLGRRAWQHRTGLAAWSAALSILLMAAYVALQSHDAARRRRIDRYAETVREGVLSLLEAQYLAPLPPLERTPGTPVSVVHPRDGVTPGSGQLGEKGVASGESLFQFGPQLFRPGPDPLAEAVRLLEDAVRQSPRTAIAHYHLARALLFKGRREDAVRSLDRALDLDPSLSPAAHLLARLIERTDPARARALLSDAQREGETRGSAFSAAWLGAQEAVLKREWRKADELFDQLQMGPGPQGEPYVGFHLDTLMERGVTRLHAGRPVEALEDFGAATAAIPRRIEPQLLAARALHLAGRETAAARKLEILHREAGAETILADEIAIGAAGLYRDRGDLSTALTWASRISDRDATTRLLHQADLLALRGEGEKAWEAARQAYGRDPDDLEVLLLLGNLCLERGEPGEARTWYGKACRIAPSDPRPPLAEAACHEQEGRLGDARRGILEALRIDPAFAPAHRDLGRILSRLGDRRGAVESYEKALELDPADALAVNNLGVIVDGDGDRERARRCYERAIEVAPGLAIAHYNLGWVFHRERRYAEAREAYETAIALGRDDGLVYSNLAPCLDHCKDPAGAVVAYEAAIERAYGGSALYHNYGTALWKVNRYEEAVAAFERAIELEPRGLYSYLYLGQLYEQMERPEDAERAYGRGVLRDPTFLEMQQDRARLRLAQATPIPGDDALRGEIATLEEAEAVGAPGGPVAWLLDEYRRAFEPRLATYASIDRLFDGPHRLVSEASRWRVLRARTPPDEDWTGLEDEHEGWQEASGTFRRPDRSIPGPSPGHPAEPDPWLFVRTVFDAPDGPGVEELRLSVRSDAAFAVYLNGSEVCRRGLVEDGGALRVPEGARFDAWWTEEALLDPEALVPSGNVLALRAAWPPCAEGEGALLVRLDSSPPPRAAVLERAERARAGCCASPAGGDEALCLYLDGRLRAFSGAPAEDLFERAIELDGSRPEPYLRLADEHIAAGEFGQAEAILRSALKAGLGRREALWARWLDVRLVELGEEPEDVLAAHRILAGEGDPSSDHERDVRWLLERLAAREPLRINCGGKDGATLGASWSRDRFFLGGKTYYLIKIDPDRHGIDPLLDRTERFFPEPTPRIRGYRIPLPRGEYRVRLRFTEGFLESPEERRFDVLVEGEAVLEGFSPRFGVPEEHSRDLAISDGTLDIDFRRATENPKISALEVIRLR